MPSGSGWFLPFFSSCLNSSKPGRKSALLAMLQPTGATPSMPTAAAVLRTVPSTLGSTVSHTTAPRTTSHGGFGSPVGSPIRPPSTARMTGAETSHTPVPPAVRSASTSLLRRIASPTVKSPPLVNTTDTPEDKTGVPPDSTPAPAPQSAVIDHVEDSAVAEMAASLASKPRRKKPVVGTFGFDSNCWVDFCLIVN